MLLATIWDREEQFPGDPDIIGNPVPPIVSPAPPIIDPDVDPIIPFKLCYETSIIAFGDPLRALQEGGPGGPVTDLLGSSNFHVFDNTLLNFENGWARINTYIYPHDANEDGQIDPIEETFSRGNLGGLLGLPVTGFAVEHFLNAFLGPAGNIIGNYGGIYGHKASRLLGSDPGFGPGEIEPEPEPEPIGK